MLVTQRGRLLQWRKLRQMLSEVLHVESVQKESGKKANKVFSPLLERLSGKKKEKG